MSHAPDPQDGPLSGVRVLDISRVIAGPYIGRLLADLGADVIKVEPPEGDPSRLIAPRHDRGMSANFTFANVGKRGLAIDLHRSEGVDLLLDLVRVSDIVIENFRPAVLARLGLGWDAIHATNPRAVLVSVNGFGHQSSFANRRAYAPIVHAITGILQDQSDYADQPVSQLSDAHADTATSLHGAVALLAALRVAEATGRGQHVEVPMFDAVLSTHSQVGRELLQPPDDRVMNPIYDAGPHGRIATAGAVQYVWRLAADAHPDIEDPGSAAAAPGADWETRMRLRHAALEVWMQAQPSAEVLLAKLEDAGIACARVVSMHDALTGGLAQERELLVEVDDGRGGSRKVVRPPARFSGSSNRVRGAAPARGQHNGEVLREVLGYDSERIAALEASGVLASAKPA